MITADAVFNQSTINPADFGKNVVSPSLSPTAQHAAAVQHIADNILPGAISDVAVPLLKACAGYTLPLSNHIINRKYPLIAQQGQIDAINVQLQALYDSAVLHFARAEVNKQVSSSVKSYDEDATQDINIGEQKLKKLVDMLRDILFGEPEPPEVIATSRAIDRPYSTSTSNNYSF